MVVVTVTWGTCRLNTLRPIVLCQQGFTVCAHWKRPVLSNPQYCGEMEEEEEEEAI